MTLIFGSGLFVLYTAGVWYVGKNWSSFNSVSDVKTEFQKAATAFETAKNNVVAEISSAEAHIADLKSLV